MRREGGREEHRVPGSLRLLSALSACTSTDLLVDRGPRGDRHPRRGSFVPLDHVPFFKFAVSFCDDAGPVASHALTEPLAPFLFSFFDCRVTGEPALNKSPRRCSRGGKRPMRKTVVNCWKNGYYNASLGSGHRGPKEERLLVAQRLCWALFE